MLNNVSPLWSTDLYVNDEIGKLVKVAVKFTVDTHIPDSTYSELDTDLSASFLIWDMGGAISHNSPPMSVLGRAFEILSNMECRSFYNPADIAKTKFSHFEIINSGSTHEQLHAGVYTVDGVTTISKAHQLDNNVGWYLFDDYPDVLWSNCKDSTWQGIFNIVEAGFNLNDMCNLVSATISCDDRALEKTRVPQPVLKYDYSKPWIHKYSTT